MVNRVSSFFSQKMATQQLKPNLNNQFIRCHKSENVIFSPIISVIENGLINHVSMDKYSIVVFTFLNCFFFRRNHHNYKYVTIHIRLTMRQHVFLHNYENNKDTNQFAQL